MELKIKQVLDREICHYASPELLITSRYNRVFVKRGETETTVEVPGDGWKGMLGSSRLARRAARLDKCNVVPVKDGLVIIRQGRVYHYNKNHGTLNHTLTLKNCRNVLHQSIAVGVKICFLGNMATTRTGRKCRSTAAGMEAGPGKRSSPSQKTRPSTCMGVILTPSKRKYGY